MTQFDVSKVQSSSLSPALQDLGAVPNVIYNYPGGVIAAGGVYVFTVVIPFTRNNIISLIKVNISGGAYANYWFPIIAQRTVWDQTINTSGGVLVVMNVKSDPGGRAVTVQLLNWLNNAAVTAAPATFTFSAHMYNYPW